VVLIIDLSGIIETFKRWISRTLTKGMITNGDFRMKPLDCDFCMNFWIGLFYIIFTGQFSILLVAYILCLSFLAEVTKDTMILLKDFLAKINRLLYKILKLDE